MSRTSQLICAILAVCGAAHSSAAQNSQEKSVYSLAPADAFVIGGSTAVSALAYVFPRAFITPRCSLEKPCDPSEVPDFDRTSIGRHDARADTLSDVTLGALLLAPPLTDWAALGSHSGGALGEDLVVFAEVLSLNGALVTMAKYSVQRPLPRVYAGEAPELVDQPGGYRSFYSGHTSLAFASLSAASMTIGYRYGFTPWPWIATALIGTSVGIERVLAGRHFPSDVIVGAIMGSAIGIGIPALHHRNAETSVRASPAGPGVSLTFAFP